jgi:hypothetical protein
MHSCDHAAQELAHIRDMILQLERLLHGPDTGPATPVMLPDYWRARIAAIQESQLPAALEQEVRTLLARLDALCAESGAAPGMSHRSHRRTAMSLRRWRQRQG